MEQVLHKHISKPPLQAGVTLFSKCSEQAHLINSRVVVAHPPAAGDIYLPAKCFLTLFNCLAGACWLLVLAS